MRKCVVSFLLVAAISFSFIEGPAIPETSSEQVEEATRTEESASSLQVISGRFAAGESFYDLFVRHGLDAGQLERMAEAARSVFDLKQVRAGRSYRIVVGPDGDVEGLSYDMDFEFTLTIQSSPDGVLAEKRAVDYERRVVRLSGSIRDTLVSALPDLPLALSLSDIFAWDIDFATDIREGDTFALVVEELWLNGEFKGHGAILAAQFVNNGHVFQAYRFEDAHGADYYGPDGRSLRRAFLKAPLSYRRISSGFTKRRFHPVLRTYRSHLGIDYAARRGTPVSSVGDGTVEFAGRKGANGNLVIIKHPAGYRTYYGHLHRIAPGVRRGTQVTQGQLIGQVGSTGRATGPHLDYRVKHRGRFLNPLDLKLPRNRSISSSRKPVFEALRRRMDSHMAGIVPFVKAGEPG